MAEQKSPELKMPEVKMPDPAQMAQLFSHIAEKSQVIVKEFLNRQNTDGKHDMQDSIALGRSFMELTQKIMSDPAKLAQAQMALWQNYMDLWQKALPAMFGQQPMETVFREQKGDKRFKHDDWQDNALFSYIKQSYLLTAGWIQDMVANVEGFDEKTKKKLQFYTRQFIDAMSPSNFVMTNPEVLRATIESGGENLVNGLKNMLDDLERGKGKLNIRMTDLNAFELGKNVATTPGKVIYQNEMMQLLQYDPSTPEVFKKPLLIFPPWINKFYIMDLRPKNSLIKWAVDQGFTVFLMSWVNPDEKMAEKAFDDYLRDGPLAALDAIEQATGEREVNALGYCLGGTLLGITNAYLAAKGTPRISSGTHLTTMLDFSQPGELEVFIEEEQIASLEKRMAVKGYLDGSEMATTFSMLRANDLMWSFFINNYLLGKDPFPFDLLYWNSDSTRMPAKMHSFYLRNFYQHNRLKEPGGISLLDTPIDLRQIKVPTYFLSAIEDHISPWTSNYAGTLLLNGPVRFVLSGSGHIAGPINPPAANKYFYWTNTKQQVADPNEWLKDAKQTEGSWWPDWYKWLSKNSGEKIPARVPGTGKLPVIEDAPGSYVKLRLAK
ncbi:MAG TPA: class I poly(R)-hydroxyalkanoic acid synthase [Gammaproteobacteria bacterium]|nr:class I poly(R)-hydroxyalkanoic acid synthase [Gammaproteobacteria bacterium]